MEREIRALIVDDEDLARLRLKSLLDELGGVAVVGEARNGIEAVDRIRELGPDVVILDIQMPGMDGFEVVEALDEVPFIIFATAYDEYAIKAFEINSIDYLLKPIEKERLAGAVGRVRRLLESRGEVAREAGRLAGLVTARGVARLPALRGKRIVLVDYSDIVWIGISEGLVFVHTGAERFLVNMTLGELEERLDPAVFFRTHRSTIVNLNHVVEIVPWFSGKYKVVVDDADRTELVLSRARAKALREIFHW